MFGSARRLSARPSGRQVGLRVSDFTLRDTTKDIVVVIIGHTLGATLAATFVDSGFQGLVCLGIRVYGLCTMYRSGFGIIEFRLRVSGFRVQLLLLRYTCVRV